MNILEYRTTLLNDTRVDIAMRMLIANTIGQGPGDVSITGHGHLPNGDISVGYDYCVGDVEFHAGIRMSEQRLLHHVSQISVQEANEEYFATFGVDLMRMQQ